MATSYKKISEALPKWHISANWVHHGAVSHNFRPNDSTSYDYSRPYLCSFEFNRPNGGISLRICLVEEYSNVKKAHDGRIYPKIRQYYYLRL